MYDLVIIGAGPAGMTAAIYGIRADLKVLLLDKLAPGGQVTGTNEVENYPGLGKINGAELAVKMFMHTQELGVAFDYKTVTEIKDLGSIKKLHLAETDEPIETKSVIIAVGSQRRTLGVPGEDQFAGSAISWCAICDGAKYRDKDVVVIGGGNSAVDEGTYLAGIVKSLTIITDYDLTADPISCDHLRALCNVTVHPYKTVSEFVTHEDGSFKGVKFADKDTGENEEIALCDGVFEYIGAIPATGFVRDLDISDAIGYIQADSHMKTKIPGIFGAGDCIQKDLRQISTACADGAIAAQEAAGYLHDLARQETNTSC